MLQWVWRLRFLCLGLVFCCSPVFSSNFRVPDPTPPPGCVKKARRFSRNTEKGSFINEGYPAPVNGLSGHEFVVSPGHGINWDGESWDWERPLLFEEREDHRTARICNRWLLPYFRNAGALVYSCRERDEQIYEIIVDAGDSDRSVQALGEWDSREDVSALGSRALETSSINSTAADAEVCFFADIPEDGFYSVSIWYPSVPNSSTHVEYIITDGGKNPHKFVINQSKNTARWNYLDRYYFKKGRNQEVLRITNAGHCDGARVTADGLRLGSGMGSVDFGGGVSGRQRWEENSQAWTQYLGAPEGVWNWGFGEHDVYTRFAYTNWQTPESLLLRIHTNAVDDARGTGSYARYWGRSEEENQKMGVVFDKMLENVWDHWDPAWCIWTTESSVTPWSFPSLVLELGFHDTLDPDMIYLRDPDFRHVICRGIYEGTVDFLTDSKGDYLPEPPSAVHVSYDSASAARVGWSLPVMGPPPTGYRINYGPCPYSLSGQMRAGGEKRHVIVPLDESGTVTYFQLRAETDGGMSFPTETLACSLPSTGTRILVVNAFDRLDWEVQETNNTHNFVIQHITALQDAGANLGLDLVLESCSNEAVETGEILLKDYFMVDWILGQESRREEKTAERGHVNDQAFSSSERHQIKQYLSEKGRIFISGSNAAWDLNEKGSQEERDFLEGQCHASFVSDNAGTSRVTALEDGMFSGMDFNFNDGKIYNVKYPDAIRPINGSIQCLVYKGTEFVAGTQYLGEDHRAVLFAFPFESIGDQETRKEIMGRILKNFLKPVNPITEAGLIDHILDSCPMAH